MSAKTQGQSWNNQNVRENDQRIQAWIPAVPGMQSDSRALGSSITIDSFQTYLGRSAKVCLSNFLMRYFFNMSGHGCSVISHANSGLVAGIREFMPQISHSQKSHDSVCYWDASCKP